MEVEEGRVEWKGKVEKWREALREVAGLQGMVLQEECDGTSAEGKQGVVYYFLRFYWRGTETDQGVVSESALHVNSPKRPYSQEFEDNSILPHQSNWKRQFMGIFSLLPSLPKFFFLQNKRCS
nr:TMV resistance protein N-like isoform X2 [Ipomoea trifida]